MIKKVIEQLNPENYEALHRELSQNRGEKFSKLLELYREGKLEDDAIRETIGINSTAYYALKSRLLDKTQEYLFRIASDTRGDLLKNISSVPQLVNNTPRETAISLLEHLETELIKVDLPRELSSVYNGLKKLHLHTDQYYHYQQLYNKSVAYSLAIDKADELLCSFNRELGYYLLSGDQSKVDILGLYIKELRHLNKLYDSHRLKSFLYLATISYSLFAGNENDIPETEETTEGLLKLFWEILEKYPDDKQYKFLITAWHFLNFEYYHKLNLHKNSIVSYEYVNRDLSLFLLLGHTCPAPHFFCAKIEYEIQNKKTSTLSNEYLENGIKPSTENVMEYFYYSIYGAACFFHSEKYQEGAAILNNCLNEISFKNFPFAEFQVKLFQTLLLLLSEKNESAEIVYRSVSRKLQSEDFPNQFPQAVAFSKFLKIAINDKSAGKIKKLNEAYSLFSLINSGQHKLLKFVPLSENQIRILTK